METKSTEWGRPLGLSKWVPEMRCKEWQKGITQLDGELYHILNAILVPDAYCIQ